MKNIYWKSLTIWCKYPWHQEVDRKIIQYSTSKKKFDQNIFLESDNQLTMHERTLLVSETLGQKINLIRIK